MTAPTLTPNGNVRIAVQLLPDTYAALKASMARDGLSMVDAVNIAIAAYDEISRAADAAGKNLGAGS